MIEQLRKIGDSSALFLDRAILEQLGLGENGRVELTVSNGLLIVAPIQPGPVEQERFESALNRVIDTRSDVLRRLAE